MSSNNKNISKQLPFYKEKIMKKKNKEFTNINLLSELPFFEKRKNFTVKDLLGEQALYKQPIRKLKRKTLTNQQLLRVLPFHDDVVPFKRQRAFRNYVSTYSVEIIDRESLMDTLNLSRTSTNELFSGLLREKRGFKYFLSIKITLKKRINVGFEIRTPNFTSKIKTVINDRYYLGELLKELINGIDQSTREGPGWIIDRVENFYINTANYEPLSGSSYIPLPKELNNSMKGLINIKNKDLKCFMWCHIRLINPQNKNAERINKKDKEIASTLHYSGIDFPMKTR